MKKVLSPCRGAPDRAAVATCPRRSAHLQVNTSTILRGQRRTGGHSIDAHHPERDPHASGRQSGSPDRGTQSGQWRTRHRVHPHQRGADRSRAHHGTRSKAAALHGTRPGPAKKALEEFHSGTTRNPGGDGYRRARDRRGRRGACPKLRASDVAEAYVHRIGRTARRAKAASQFPSVMGRSGERWRVPTAGRRSRGHGCMAGRIGSRNAAVLPYRSGRCRSVTSVMSSGMARA
jgi:hypothetical protein